MATPLTTTSDPFASGRPREINVTCRYCGRSQRTWTRRGLRFTCRHCKRTQEGPAGITRLVDRLQPPAAIVVTPTTVKIASVNGAHKPPAAKAAAPPAVVKPTSKAPSQPTPPAPPAPPRKDIVSRVLGF